MVAVVTATMSGVATIVAIVLIVLTSALNDVNSRLATAIERVRLLMELESQALQANRDAAHGMIEVLSRLQKGHGDQFTREMQALVDEITLIDTAATSADREARTVFALTSLRDVVVRENNEAREATALAASRRRLANTVALVGILVLVVGFVVPLFWIQRRAIRPLVAVGDAIERFAVGDHTVRAPQVGARRVSSCRGGFQWNGRRAPSSNTSNSWRSLRESPMTCEIR
jgi:hypothetical protein